VLTASGQVLKKYDRFQIPGDSAFRSIAIIEVGP
jgi:hypothetical protein